DRDVLIADVLAPREAWDERAQIGHLRGTTIVDIPCKNSVGIRKRIVEAAHHIVLVRKAALRAGDLGRAIPKVLSIRRSNNVEIRRSQRIHADIDTTALICE